MNVARVIRAPRGTQISCQGWLQEAALRMLMNNRICQGARCPSADDRVMRGT